MKYIEIEKIKAEIERLKSVLADPVCECLTSDYKAGGNKMADTLLSFIDTLEQDAPTPPGIEEERQKKGWLDYGLMMSEIGLHRYNAIHRIKEHKGQFDPLRVPDLYHVAEYYESVGVEKVCCCLQAYSKDFRFDQTEVKEIIEKEE